MSGWRRGESLAEYLERSNAKFEQLCATPHYVYRAFDDLGLLLYIGCTVNVEKRLAAHRRGPWHRFMASHTVEDFPARAEARAAERSAIDSEGAYFNSTHADMVRTQANQIAAGRALAAQGIVVDPCPKGDDYDSPEWVQHEADHLAYYELREEVAAQLKLTTHPYLTDEDRVARYLAARTEAERGAA